MPLRSCCVSLLLCPVVATLSLNPWTATISSILPPFCFLLHFILQDNGTPLLVQLVSFLHHIHFLFVPSRTPSSCILTLQPYKSANLLLLRHNCPLLGTHFHASSCKVRCYRRRLQDISPLFSCTDWPSIPTVICSSVSSRDWCMFFLSSLQLCLTPQESTNLASPPHNPLPFPC